MRPAALLPRFLLLLAALVLLPPASPAAVVEGRVVHDDRPLAGMVVAAYPNLDPSGRPAAWAAATDDDGRFSLELPAGTYALFASSADRDLFAFCGRNPVVVGDAPVWAGLQAVPAFPAEDGAYDDAYSAAVVGRVLYRGEPLAGAHVSLYLDAAEDLKGQGYRMSPPTGADGRFAFDGLPESDYFLVARKRAGGGRVGPLLEGDYLAVYPGNPLTAEAGRVLTVTLEAVRKLKESGDSETFGRGGGPVLRGRVVDDAGRPVAGVHVFVYTDRVIGHQRPAALSAPTGADGRFVVNLPAAGTYYVGARQDYGDSPAPGELFGMYDETADHGLEIAAGKIREGLRIVVEPITLD
jgi:uncharacterized GH25 family protein